MATRNLAVMFTDIKGFTARTSDSTRDGVRSLLDEHDRLLRPVFRHFDGTVVKTIGDAFLVYFESPTDAVICGLAIQSVLKKFNTSVSEKERIAVRVAINVGDVEMVDGDVLGEPVNIAARLEAITEPGEVWFTEAVYLTMNRKEAPSAEIGERTFKGIPLPVRVYKVISDPPSEQLLQIDRSVRLERGKPQIEGIGPTRVTQASWRPYAAAAVVALLVGPLLAVFGYDALGNWQMQRRIDRLIAIEDPVAALEAIDEALARRPDDLELRTLARRATEMNLDRRIARHEDGAVTLQWLEAEMAAKPYLDGLKPRLARLEAEVKLNEAIRSRGRDDAFWGAFRELIRRYPEGTEVPLAAVEVLKGANRIVATHLWPYELVIERGGGLPDDPELQQAILDASLQVLDGYPPASGYGERAHALTGAHFEEARAAWAEQALTEGGGYAVLNALVILEEAGDPRVSEPFHLALRAVAAADADPAIFEVLRALEDARQGRLVLEILTGTRPDMRSGTSSESRAAFAELRDDLRVRFPAD
jgi:class 3 adenylate cyclase